MLNNAAEMMSRRSVAMSMGSPTGAYAMRLTYLTTKGGVYWNGKRGLAMLPLLLMLMLMLPLLLCLSLPSVLPGWRFLADATGGRRISSQMGNEVRTESPPPRPCRSHCMHARMR